MATSSTTVASAGPTRPAPIFLAALTRRRRGRLRDHLHRSGRHSARSRRCWCSNYASNSSLSRGKFGWTFLCTPDLGPGQRPIWRAALHLRHGGDFVRGAAHRDSAGRRGCHLPGGTGPAQDLRRADISDRIAGRRSQRDLSGCSGSSSWCRSCASPSRSFARCSAGPLCFSGPFYGVSLFSAGVVMAVMIIPFIISISREVILAVPEISAKRPWRWARRAGKPPGMSSFRTPRRASWGPFFWLWPARWARPWPSPWSSATIQNQSLAVRARLFHRRRDRQRIHGSHRPACTPAP